MNNLKKVLFVFSFFLLSFVFPKSVFAFPSDAPPFPSWYDSSKDYFYMVTPDGKNYAFIQPLSSDSYIYINETNGVGYFNCKSAIVAVPLGMDWRWTESGNSVNHVASPLVVSNIYPHSKAIVYNSLDRGSVFYSPVPVVPVASDVKFIQPSISPFKDTTDGYNFLVSYSVPVNTSVADVSIKFSSPLLDPSDWSITQQEYNKLTGVGWVKVFVTSVPVGSHVVTCTINTVSVSTTIERLSGIVDSDGDGIDDRTNQPVDDGHADYTDIDGKGVATGISALTGFLTTMTSFSTKIFSFMPNEVKVIMVFVISVMGFIAIKKFIL